MTSRGRLAALLALFAVAFGALWPLVSVARPSSAEVPSFICTQSGFQHPGDPAQHDDKFHCPLCVVGMEAPPPAAPVASALAVVAASTQPSIASPAPRERSTARSPPSRAPPSFS